jgi:hypothetical protein
MVVLVLSRWPGLMPQNFSAAYAIVFCAGLYVPGALGWIVPLVVLAASDWLLSFVFYSNGAFSWSQFLIQQAPNYLVYASLIALGRMVGRRRPWWLLVGGGVAGAMLFYLVTNTAAWLASPYYAKTLGGWVQALTRGMPQYPPTWEFFRNTLTSGGLFTGLFVGAMKMTGCSEAREKDEDEEEEAEGEPAEADS